MDGCMQGADDSDLADDRTAEVVSDDRELAKRYRRFAERPERGTYRMRLDPLPDDVERLVSQLDRLLWHVESVREALVAGNALEPPAWLGLDYRQGSNQDIARQLIEAHGACAYAKWSRARLAAAVVRWRANLRFMFETGRQIFPEHGTAGALRLLEAMGTPIAPELTRKAESLMRKVIGVERISPWDASVLLTQALISRRYASIANDFARQGADQVVKETPDGPEPDFQEVISMIRETLKWEASRRKPENRPSETEAQRARPNRPKRGMRK